MHLHPLKIQFSKPEASHLHAAKLTAIQQPKEYPVFEQLEMPEHPHTFFSSSAENHRRFFLMFDLWQRQKIIG
jgi:hypothetical protein